MKLDQICKGNDNNKKLGSRESMENHILTYFRQIVLAALLALGLKGPSLLHPSYPFSGVRGQKKRRGRPPGVVEQTGTLSTSHSLSTCCQSNAA